MILPPEVPRIYTSFAEFERDELERLGLTAWPASVADSPAVIAASPPPLPALLPAPPPAPSTAPTTSRPRTRVSISRATPAALIAMRAEGVLEIGCATGTSTLFVRTRRKLHLLHATWLPDRPLDDYAVNLAVTWIEDHGLPSYAVAENLGISETTLRHALTAAGYERLSPERHAQLERARSARKFGNRRGRLVPRLPASHAAESAAL